MLFRGKISEEKFRMIVVFFYLDIAVKKTDESTSPNLSTF